MRPHDSQSLQTELLVPFKQRESNKDSNFKEAAKIPNKIKGKKKSNQLKQPLVTTINTLLLESKSSRIQNTSSDKSYTATT